MLGVDPTPETTLPSVVQGREPAASPADPAGDERVAEEEDSVSQPQLKRPKPKLGKIAFNIQGGSIAAAQAKVQVEEAVAAARARRLNTKDASTQTVRDPEHQDQDGAPVTIWRLRPRGMESFPHFPKATKRKVREPTICAAAEDGEDREFFAASGTVNPDVPEKDVRKRRLDAGPGAPQQEDLEGPTRATVEAAPVAEAPQGCALPPSLLAGAPVADAPQGCALPPSLLAAAPVAEAPQGCALPPSLLAGAPVAGAPQGCALPPSLLAAAPVAEAPQGCALPPSLLAGALVAEAPQGCALPPSLVAAGAQPVSDESSSDSESPASDVLQEALARTL